MFWKTAVGDALALVPRSFRSPSGFLHTLGVLCHYKEVMRMDQLQNKWRMLDLYGRLIQAEMRLLMDHTPEVLREQDQAAA